MSTASVMAVLYCVSSSLKYAASSCVCLFNTALHSCTSLDVILLLGPTSARSRIAFSSRSRSISSMMFSNMAMCRARRRAVSSSSVRLLLLALMRMGMMVTLPLAVLTTEGSPLTSRFERGGNSSSSSDGYCESQLSDAPRSTCPTLSSNTIGSPRWKGMYCTATSRLALVDRNPNSTPPRQPNSSFFQNCSGSATPAMPR
mmetsp:Transcript_37837/g.92989  ORF Transcript_37837/g.92989 Transcript_37837/m.92989 type:complete len:201 (-) Transcript_37837:1435-2037(-)